MPRYLILVLFCGVIAVAVGAGATPAIGKDGNDGSNNFKQPNLKPYENLASVLKASYKKPTTTNANSVTKKSSSTSKSKSLKKTSSSPKSSINKTNVQKRTSHSTSNHKKKNNQKPKNYKKSV